MSVHKHNFLLLCIILLANILYSCQKNDIIPLQSESFSESHSNTEKSDDVEDHHSAGSDQQSLLFAGGTSISSGWVDVDKLHMPKDYMSCWLITASNMIEWWQKRYIDLGNILPEKIPQGKGSGPYGCAVFDYSIEQFDDLEKGGDIGTGLSWYIDGVLNDITNHARPKPSTGGLLQGIDTNLISYCKKAYSTYDDWSQVATEQDALSIFSNKILTKLRQGYVIGLDVKCSVGYGGALHAVTLWGAEVNEQGNISKIYITDSDDDEHRLSVCDICTSIDYFQTKVVVMTVPKSKAYQESVTWEILRMYFLQDPQAIIPF